MKTQNKKCLYRYIDYHSSSVSIDEWGEAIVSTNTDNTQVQCEAYEIIRTTPKGVWIDNSRMYRLINNGASAQTTSDERFKQIPAEDKRFVLLSANVPWAYDTKEAALKSFIIRKERQAGHLTRQLQGVKLAIAIAKNDCKPLTIEQEFKL